VAYERFKKDFNENYSGAVNAGKMLFLEEGGKAHLLERDMEKMQVLESRKHAVTEICRIWGVPPHLCMDLEKATFSNIEHQSAEFVRDCINPLSVRLEQGMYRDLLTETEQMIYFFKFNTNALMRGDTATRGQFYNTMRQTGVMSANEVRRLEDMDERPAEDGADDLHVNGNMMTLQNARSNIPKGAQKGA
jgi:HK97 family phage portal protein